MIKSKPATSNDRQYLLNAGQAETKNLAEGLAVDFEVLLRTLFPQSAKAAGPKLSQWTELGILKRMIAFADLLLEGESPEVLADLVNHSSDTARGWGAFVVGRQPHLSLKQRMKRIMAYADDSHFGVREWAWLAVRSHLARDVDEAIRILQPWTNHKSFRVRRFASEAIRPRGVWAEHIHVLKEKPELGLPILNPLKADPERYVQDSVGNWLNDAAKSQPKWVRQVCVAWQKESSSPSTAYIIKRAQRSLATATGPRKTK